MGTSQVLSHWVRVVGSNGNEGVTLNSPELKNSSFTTEYRLVSRTLDSFKKQNLCSPVHTIEENKEFMLQFCNDIGISHDALLISMGQHEHSKINKLPADYFNSNKNSSKVFKWKKKKNLK